MCISLGSTVSHDVQISWVHCISWYVHTPWVHCISWHLHISSVHCISRHVHISWVHCISWHVHISWVHCISWRAHFVGALYFVIRAYPLGALHFVASAYLLGALYFTTWAYFLGALYFMTCVYLLGALYFMACAYFLPWVHCISWLVHTSWMHCISGHATTAYLSWHMKNCDLNWAVCEKAKRKIMILSSSPLRHTSLIFITHKILEHERNGVTTPLFAKHLVQHRNHPSFALLALCEGNQLVDSPHKGPVMRTSVIMSSWDCCSIRLLLVSITLSVFRIYTCQIKCQFVG